MKLVEFCQDLTDFPMRGRARDDVYPGLRTLGYRRRATVAFTVTGAVVEIQGVYYGRRDLDALLAEQFGEEG